MIFGGPEKTIKRSEEKQIEILNKMKATEEELKQLAAPDIFINHMLELQDGMRRLIIQEHRIRLDPKLSEGKKINYINTISKHTQFLAKKEKISLNNLRRTFKEKKKEKALIRELAEIKKKEKIKKILEKEEFLKGYS